MIRGNNNSPSSESRKEDILLIKQINQQDMRAFKILVDKYKERTVRLAYSITGNLSDAQDIAQDVFIRVYKNLIHFRSDCSFSTWLYRIVINISRDFLRKKKRSSLLFNHTMDKLDIAQSRADDKMLNPSNVLINKELKSKIDGAVLTLSVKQQIAFGLKYRNGLKISEIAEIMKLNISTIKVHLFRAVNNLQKKLSVEEGGV